MLPFKCVLFAHLFSINLCSQQNIDCSCIEFFFSLYMFSFLQLECCGIEKYTDWFSLTPVNDLEETVNSVTRGCCLPEYAKQHGLCYENLRYATIQEVEQRIYTIGCFPRVEQLLDSAVGLAMGIICIIFIVVQVSLLLTTGTCLLIVTEANEVPISSHI